MLSLDTGNSPLILVYKCLSFDWNSTGPNICLKLSKFKSNVDCEKKKLAKP